MGLGAAEQRQLVEPRLGRRQRRRQQVRDVAPQTLDRGAVEQLPAILQAAMQAPLRHRRPERQGEIELGGPGVDRQRRRPQPGERR